MQAISCQTFLILRFFLTIQVPSFDGIILLHLLFCSEIISINFLVCADLVRDLNKLDAHTGPENDAD